MPIGTVKEVAKDYTVVTIERQEMCGDCHACDMMGERKLCEIRCSNTYPVQPQDRVEVDIANQTFLKATGVMYGIPLAAMLIGLLIGSFVPDAWGTYAKEIAMLVLSIGLMVSAFCFVKKRDRANKYAHFLPSIKKVYDKEV